MEKWLRRLRGAVGMGLAWATAWFAAGMGLLVVVGLDAADVPFPLFFGFLGFLSGVTFSGILAIAEGRRRFDEVSLPRFAGWGALGGLLLSVIFVSVTTLLGDMTPDVLTVLGPVFGVAGAGSAAASLALARMAEEGEALEAGDSPAEPGPNRDEARELSGGGAP